MTDYFTTSGKMVVVTLFGRVTHGVHASGAPQDGSLHGMYTFCGHWLLGGVDYVPNYQEVAPGSDVTCKRCRQSVSWDRRAQQEDRNEEAD